MKHLIKKYIPIQHIIKAQRLLNKHHVNKVEALLDSFPEKKMYLSYEDLERLTKTFPKPPPYNYSLEALQNRGAKRSHEIKKIIKHDADIVKTLEIGAKDGMVSYYLNKKLNKKCTCVDLNPKPIENLSYGDTKFVKGDVCQLPFESESFDLAFSYNSFEHFHQPRKALLEMLRVLRPNGILYLDFGPIYYAPKGLHLYNKVFIPYCQLLFEFKTLEEYCLAHNLGAPKFNIGKGLSGWSIGQYRNLWNEINQLASIDQYYENPTYAGLKLVEKYPEYFKGKFESIDDLIITQIQIKLKKK